MTDEVLSNEGERLVGSRAEQIQAILESDIFSGKLAPGARLDEVDLATRFNVSRTPVREALRHLASAGLIQIRNRQPAQVVQLSAHRLIEMFQVMAELEGLCARLAARRITAQELEGLRALHTQLIELARTDKVEAFYEINRLFHEGIYAASQNEFLAEQTRALRNRIGAYRRLVTQRPSRRRDTLREHEDVLRCLAEGDDGGAAEAMRGHVNLLGEKLLDFLALFPKDMGRAA
ncbi:GntR family transcriptional regulator [Verticiella sediminum]|uniref:GntR family transcriptional regulator n=1 Tax=Verticiella sediminum TaxID=1247510 RepID=A0A556A995_9BURK|nr:GntR family transcriptional regulator [Verticiella sediminum]TSH89441.1 GntR family transcriptional regulator [Verticiella sediminum]